MDATSKSASESRHPELPISFGVFFVLGIGVGFAFFVMARELDHAGGTIFSVAVGALAALGIGAALVAAFAFIVVPRVLGRVNNTLEGVIRHATEAANAHAKGDSEMAIRHTGLAVSEASIWYLGVRVRHSLSQVALGLLVAFGGIVGSALLITQNSLLREQNIKLDQQTNLLSQQNVTSEAQRRSALLSELFDVLKDVAEDNPRAKEGSLSPGLVSRINVLTHAAQPYFYVRYQKPLNSDGPARASVIENPLSPERGQLLIGLIANGVSLRQLTRAVFDFADLRNVQLAGADLSRVGLAYADFTGANLTRVNFESANLLNAHFNAAQIMGSSFKNLLPTGGYIDFQSAMILRSTFDSKQENLRLSRAIVGRVDGPSDDDPVGLDTTGYKRVIDGRYVRLELIGEIDSGNSR